ncbi:uncharacterized protein LOC114645279 [Erpetoichthys calabaricus]|uniref:uncharacterized protein LOC114645279 n=1 Tax=Erpetoichthys calabaricus TaxID=27687 RepID=UPI00223483AA|nr:uncharacterized protein LOC114645279 [Erpetoichthys calabaricus]
MLLQSLELPVNSFQPDSVIMEDTLSFLSKTSLNTSYHSHFSTLLTSSFVPHDWQTENSQEVIAYLSSVTKIMPSHVVTVTAGGETSLTSFTPPASSSIESLKFSPQSYVQNVSVLLPVILPSAQSFSLHTSSHNEPVVQSSSTSSHAFVLPVTSSEETSSTLPLKFISTLVESSLHSVLPSVTMSLSISIFSMATPRLDRSVESKSTVVQSDSKTSTYTLLKFPVPSSPEGTASATSSSLKPSTVSVPASSVSLSFSAPSNISGIQTENLLTVTLKVDSSVNIFNDSFRSAIAKGLEQTFLTALMTNQGKSKRQAVANISVEILNIFRVDMNNVMVQFAVLQDGKPLTAAAASMVFSRLPDPMSVLNQNLPFKVSQTSFVLPSSTSTSVPDFTAWIAAVAVLSVICASLLIFLAIHVKKKWKVVGVASSDSTPSPVHFQKDHPGTAKIYFTEDIERGKKESKSAPVLLPSEVFESPDITQQHDVSDNQKPSTSNTGCKGDEDKAVKRVPMFSTQERSIVPSFQNFAEMNKADCVTRIPVRFRSSVVPLPPLKSQRLTVLDTDEDDENEVGVREKNLIRRNTKVPPEMKISISKAEASRSDIELQRKADAERERNKKRQRQKHRLKVVSGKVGPSTEETEEECIRKASDHEKKKKKKEMKKEKELLAWKNAQAQLGSLLNMPVPAYNGLNR